MGLLALHDLKCLLGAQKRAREIRVHHSLPLLIAEIFERDAWGTDPSVVEQHIETAKRLLSLREQGTHRSRITHVGGHDQGLSCRSASLYHRLLQQLLASSGKRHAIALLQKGERNRLADTSTRSSNEGNFGMWTHT
jgi:hypothetical protein